MKQPSLNPTACLTHWPSPACSQAPQHITRMRQGVSDLRAQMNDRVKGLVLGWLGQVGLGPEAGKGAALKSATPLTTAAGGEVGYRMHHQQRYPDGRRLL